MSTSTFNVLFCIVLAIATSMVTLYGYDLHTNTDFNEVIHKLRSLVLVVSAVAAIAVLWNHEELHKLEQVAFVVLVFVWSLGIVAIYSYLGWILWKYYLLVFT